MNKMTGLFLALVMMSTNVMAQKVKTRNGDLEVNGKKIAKITKTKNSENFGLTSTFEIYSLGGEKLITATWEGNFEEITNSHVNYYKLEFIPVNMVGIFTVAKLGGERSFANLIGQSGVIVNDKLDRNRVEKLLLAQGKEPKYDYTLVERDFDGPIYLNKDKTIKQKTRVIGTFQDITSTGHKFDSYEFILPSGVVVAEVMFSNGNESKEFELHTKRDKMARIVDLEEDLNMDSSITTVDRNQWVLMRVTQWLVNAGYL